MKLYLFKHADGGIVVEYDNGADVVRLTTMDQPREDLLQAEQNILRFAMDHFGITGIACSLRSIDISHGDNAGTKLTLNIPTHTGDRARLVMPKISDHVVVDKKGEPVDCPKNYYLGHLEVFEKEVTEFIKGKKAQLALPFDDLQDADEDGDGEEEGSRGDLGAAAVEFVALAKKRGYDVGVDVKTNTIKFTEAVGAN